MKILMLLIFSSTLLYSAEQDIIEKYRSVYENNLNKIKSKLAIQKAANSNAAYQEIKKIEAAYQKAGNLEKLISLRKLIETLNPDDLSIVSTNDAALKPIFAKLLKSNMDSLAVYNKSLNKLNQSYRAALQKQVSLLTKQNKIEQAIAVQKVLEKVSIETVKNDTPQNRSIPYQTSKPLKPGTPIIRDLADSQKSSKTWRYITQKPADDWMKTSFNDHKWRQGRAGFGRKRNLPIKTNWHSKEIWIRRKVNLNEVPAEARLIINNDDAAAVYVNGISIVQLKNYSKKYREIDLSKEQLKAFKKGSNIIAAYCLNKGGEQYIDVGFNVISVYR